MVISPCFQKKHVWEVMLYLYLKFLLWSQRPMIMQPILTESVFPCGVLAAADQLLWLQGTYPRRERASLIKDIVLTWPYKSFRAPTVTCDSSNNQGSSSALAGRYASYQFPYTTLVISHSAPDAWNSLLEKTKLHMYSSTLLHVAITTVGATTGILTLYNRWN